MTAKGWKLEITQRQRYMLCTVENLSNSLPQLSGQLSKASINKSLEARAQLRGQLSLPRNEIVAV